VARIAVVERRSVPELMAARGDDLGLVQGLARGLAVLRAFRPNEAALSNAEIASRTGLPKATVSRLTHTLTVLGYLAFVPRLARYALGPAVVSLCHSLLAGMPTRIAARPVLQELADYARLPVSLGARDQLDMVYIETARHALGHPARFDLGSRLPLECTAMGRAYLWALPTDEREALLDVLRAAKGASAWRRIRAGIDRAFDSIAKRGFCLSLGDWRTDVFGAGAPLVAGDGTALAINCGGPPFEVSAERMEKEIGPRLAHSAALIAQRAAA
jgi:DNA-binding IclR family transcriptional regulator